MMENHLINMKKNIKHSGQQGKNKEEKEWKN